MTAGVHFTQDLALILLLAGGLGWLCHQFGISAIVGYLLAGMLISPTGLLAPVVSAFPLVYDIQHIQMLAQVGLVFLMFALGFDLSLSRVRKQGLPLVGVTLIGTIIIFNGFKLLGPFFGLGAVESLFAAAMLMVSSTTVIEKWLQRTGRTHERVGRLSMGVAVIEDGITVLMLTVLGSLSQLGLIESVEALGMAGGFVILILISALFIVPRFLKELERSARPEIQSVILVGLVLGVAWAVVKAGYPVALGAVILGAVVGGTKFRSHVERLSGSVRNVFVAFFFVAVGVWFDVGIFRQHEVMILALSGVALLIRPVVYSILFILAGKRSDDAIRAGLLLTPMGEFTFIIAQFGVLSEMLPVTYYTIVVGVALTTIVGGAALWRASDAVVKIIDVGTPGFFKKWVTFYHAWLNEVAGRGQSSQLWQLSARRIVQVGIQFFFITGMLVFYKSLFNGLQAWMGGRLSVATLEILFGLAMGILLVIPAVGLWRNISALALLYAHATTRNVARREQWQPLVELIIKALAAIPLIVWLVALMPFNVSLAWVILLLVGLIGLTMIVLRRKIISWNSLVEYELAQTVQVYGEHDDSGGWLGNYRKWDLTLKEVSLPDQPDCAGRTLGDIGLHSKFGCSVVGIDRQGFALSAPSAQTPLYPRDNLLLLGTEDQVAEAETFLKQSTHSESLFEGSFRDTVMEVIRVEEGSLALGRSLAELALPNRYGVLVTAIRRNHTRIAGPSAEERLQAGDELLILGTVEQVKTLHQAWTVEKEEGIS
ncbi:MAG: cation:proton antiporter [Verrucomicrobiota bacterium]